MTTTFTRQNDFDHLEFDFKGISDLRSHEAVGLEEGYCELDPVSLETMRHVYGADTRAQSMVDLYERRLVYGKAPNTPRLHAEVLASTLALVRMSKPESVLDLGCGVGLLTRALVREQYIKRVVGADIDERHVRVAKALLPEEALPHKPAIEMQCLDVTSFNDRKSVRGIDFIALTEVVQQIRDRNWISNIFEINPKIVVVTSPNKDFNAIYPPMLLCENGLRDPDHEFEFTQQEFTEWATTYGERYGYSLDILPLGPADTVHGPASLMAVFQRKSSASVGLDEVTAIEQSPIVQAATNPLQYDSGDLDWEAEGSRNSPNRRLFLEYLRPTFREMADKRVIDIGCGQGWLCDEIARFGGRPLGLDPSKRCLEKARALYPHLELYRASLQEFYTEEQFDAAFMIMVENFLEMEVVFREVRQLLKPYGRFILIVDDFERSTNGLDHKLELEVVDTETVAIRIECPGRFGVLCDIIHPLQNYIQAAEDAGFTFRKHTKILPESWHPRYKTHKGKSLFHLLEFSR